MTMVDLPKAVMRSESDCPMVKAGEGVKLQLLKVDIEVGLWVIRNLFEPGARVQTHKHTGQVFAFTQSGCWKYDEYPELMTAGTYLFEPAGSIHTLIVPEDNTEVTDVWFAIYGANLNLDADGNVESVSDAETILRSYRSRCRKMGIDDPPV